MLKKSSVLGEYYFGDLPGTLQYNISINSLRLGLDNIISNETNGYNLIEDLYSIPLDILLPHTKDPNNYIILFAIKKEIDDKIWIKSALLNILENKIALLTTTNEKKNLTIRNYRAIKSIEGNWHIGHFRMSAPIIFWKELRTFI